MYLSLRVPRMPHCLFVFCVCHCLLLVCTPVCLSLYVSLRIFCMWHCLFLVCVSVCWRDNASISLQVRGNDESRRTGCDKVRRGCKFLPKFKGCVCGRLWGSVAAAGTTDPGLNVHVSTFKLRSKFRRLTAPKHSLGRHLSLFLYSCTQRHKQRNGAGGSG